MALVLTEEQTLLKETAAQFFKATLPIDMMRKLRDEKSDQGYDHTAWREITNLGFSGIMVPEQYGGTGFGPIGMGLVMEEIGRNLSATPFTSTVLLCGSAIQLAGTAAQRQAYLPAIASGEKIMALALEEGPHHRPYAISAKADDMGDGFKITGRKTLVLDGHVANMLIVAARTSGTHNDPNGITLFLVDPAADGVSITRTHLADGRNAANVVLTDVSVAESDVLGSIDGGADVLDPVLDLARIGISAEMLGIIQEAFDRTIEYLRERKQFGVPIGSFQALKHRAALMFCEIEICRSIVLDALTALEERRNDIPQIASLAKAKLSQTARLVTNETLQMHGGMGMTDEFDFGLFMKRARVSAATFGDANYHTNRYAEVSGF